MQASNVKQDSSCFSQQQRQQHTVDVDHTIQIRNNSNNMNLDLERSFSLGKIKSYITHIIITSNLPFAYSFMLIAFVITIIAALSIIIIITIISTITGYTVYPSMDNTFNASLLVGVICASFALALVIVSFIMWRKYFQAAYYYLDDPPSATRGNSPQLSETYDDSDYGSTPISDWSKHVQKLHADGDIGFSREYEQIQKATNLNLSCEHSQMPENKHKNRYINIVAYDHSRVLLRQIPGQKKPGSDYINANFIDVSTTTILSDYFKKHNLFKYSIY